MRNSQQLKGPISNKAKASGVPADTALHMYVMERFLERLANSQYRGSLILKGGYLLYSHWGLGNRTTSDLDLTHKSLEINDEEASGIVESICSVNVDDGFRMSLTRTRPIAEVLDHPGIRAYIMTEYGIREQFYVDIVPSPSIVPEEVIRGIQPMFGDQTIDVLAYRLETVIAEKLHAALTRDVENTRMRDYYDFYVLEHNGGIDPDLLRIAINHIFSDRGTSRFLENWTEAMENIRRDEGMNKLWTDYQSKLDHGYARGISFDDACDSAVRLLETSTSGSEKP